MPCGAPGRRDASEDSDLTVVFLCRALTTRAQPITQRAAPFHCHPRTLSTCSSSESQHATALQKGSPAGWMAGKTELDTPFVNSVHLRHWLEASEMGHGEDIGGERCSRGLGILRIWTSR